MNDRQLETILGRRAHLMPAGSEATARAMAALGLDAGAGLAGEIGLDQVVPAKRNPWTIPVIAVPALLSGALVFMLQKEAVLGLGASLGDGLPHLMQLTATAWQQVVTGLAPGVLLMLGVTLMVGCLFASWSLGTSFTRQVKSA